MKNFTFKSMLVCVALASTSTAMQAQRVTFQKNDEISNQLRETHRTAPLWADFNNDGLMDIYYSGTSCKHGWTSGGFLVKNLGNMQIEMDTEQKKEVQQVQVGTDDTTGEAIYEDREVVVGMVNGLPYTAFGMGSQSLDFNQDGLIDFIFVNRGGNDTGTRKEFVLVKNLGNYKFEKVEDEALAALPHGENNDCFNEGQDVGCLSIGDYNKDGYPDLITQGNGQEGRFVRLLKNVEGDHFEVADVFNPLPYEVETNKLGIYKKTEETVDEEGITIPGAYTQERTMKPKAMSHGSVLFADFDNDGWLDIVSTGYMDGDDSDPVAGSQIGGDAIRFYRNLQNGEFQDVTDHLCAEGETVDNVFQRWGTEDTWLSALDFNQDGKIDLTMVGSVRGRDKKQAIVLLNVYDAETGKFAFQEETTGLAPISGTTCRMAAVADLNGDDYPDYAMGGWTSYEDRNDWAWAMSYSEDANYVMDWFNPNEPDGIGGHFSEATMSYGDINGDGLLDMIASNWWTNGDTVCVSLNTTADAVVTAPEAPANVAATYDDGKLTVTWDAASLPISGNEPLYNLYVQDKNTGATRMIVPANVETGFQLGYSWFNSYVLSGGEEPSYTFENIPVGEYVVGVQTVSYSYAASAFATAEIDLTGIDNVSSAQGLKVVVGNNTVLVKGEKNVPVSVYSVSGSLVASGVTNAPILLNGQGLYIVKAGEQASKIVK